MRKRIKSITDPMPESAKYVNATVYDKARKYFEDYPADFKALKWKKQPSFDNMIVAREDDWDFKELGVHTVVMQNLVVVHRSFQNGTHVCIYKKDKKNLPAFLVMSPTMTFEDGYLLYWEL